MENATAPLSEEAAAIQQRKLEELRKYNRDYYHAHKKASECSRLQVVRVHCRLPASKKVMSLWAT